jgi:hypothetical protein
MNLAPDPVVLGFTLALAAVTGALFSAAPAWAMARTRPMDALRGGRSGEQRSFVPRRSLVVLQVALSLILLAGAGLLTESLRRCSTSHSASKRATGSWHGSRCRRFPAIQRGWRRCTTR